MVSVRILGPLEVVDGDAVTRPAGRTQRLLLAALAIEPGREWTRDRLAELLWPGELPVDPPAALRSQIARLRRAIGPAGAAIETTPTGYRLALAADAVDHEQFRAACAEADQLGAAGALRAADRALALWRGPVLADLDDHEPIAGFVASVRDRHLAVRLRRAQVLMELGRPDEATDALRLMAAERGDHEAVQTALVRALYLAGRAHEALAHADAWRREMAEEYGLDPSPALRRLEQEILDHGAGLAAGAPPERLVGRDADLRTVLRLLAPGTVTTLVGPGGVGKTRLAREVTAQAGTRFGAQRAVVDLSALARPGDVARAVARALQIEERPGQRLLDTIVDALSTARALLVLDACEHLVEAVSLLVEALRRRAGDVTILATSRVRLSVAGERVVDVAPLDAESALALFAERVAAACPAVTLAGADLDVARAIAERLDRLPLALELAAVAARTFTLPELLARLEDRFAVLAGGPRHLARHRSLRAMVDSSYADLDEQGRRALADLAVFAGAFDVDAATAVMGQGPAPLLELADRSLLQVERASPTRFTLLDTIRAYGRERLADEGRTAVMSRRHATWALELAEAMGAAIHTSEEVAVARRVGVHLDELRAAHEWWMAEDATTALRLSGALRFYALTRAAGELHRWTEIARAANAGGSSTPAMAAGWSMACVGAWRRGDLDSAEQAARAAVTCRTPDPLDRRHGLEATAELALLRGDADRAAAGYLAAADLAGTAGEGFAVVWDVASAALALHYARPGQAVDAALLARLDDLRHRVPSPSAQSFLRFTAGELGVAGPSAAEQDLRSAWALAEDAGATFLAGLAEVGLAALLSRREDPGPAFALYATVIERWHADGVWTSQWITLRSLIGFLARRGDAAQAARLWGAERSRRTGSPAYGLDAAALADAHLVLRDRLGAERLQALAHEGRQMSDEGLVQLALDAVGAAI